MGLQISRSSSVVLESIAIIPELSFKKSRRLAVPQIHTRTHSPTPCARVEGDAHKDSLTTRVRKERPFSPPPWGAFTF